MKLYEYYRSTTSYRVRIAIQLKQLEHQVDVQHIHLIEQGGQHRHPNYLGINPQGLVPSLTTEDGYQLNQSLAILEYLDEVYPNPSLLPSEPTDKAIVRGLSQIIGCDIHPLNNLRVLNQLKNEFSANEDQIQSWYHHWLKLGFDAIEAQLSRINPDKTPGTVQYCYQNTLSIADLCLIPQVYNAKRFKFPMDDYPNIIGIELHCMSLPAFIKASPDQL